MTPYPVLQSQQLGQKPVKVIWQNTPIVLFRDHTRTACAFYDKCPHLETPLSDGWVADGRLVCPWHQWEFTSDGQCRYPISMAQYQCQTYAVQETHDWIWVGQVTAFSTHQGFALSPPQIDLSRNLADWRPEGLSTSRPDRARLGMMGQQCEVQLFHNTSPNETHTRVGIWYPLEWPADPDRPKISDIMKSALTHLQNGAFN